MKKLALVFLALVSFSTYAQAEEASSNALPPPRWECTSQDVYGTTYSRTGFDPRRLQRDVHDYCVYRSQGPCRDLGCRRF
jgi:hypothetical protein